MLPTVGGQTALNLAVDLDKAGTLEKFGVKLIGASIDAIKVAEDRQLFKDAMRSIGLDVPQSGLARNFAEAHGPRQDARLPARHPPVVHAGRRRRRHRLQQSRSSATSRSAASSSARCTKS